MSEETKFQSEVKEGLGKIIDLLGKGKGTTISKRRSNNGGSNDDDDEDKAAEALDELLGKNKELLKVKDDIRKLDESRNELEEQIKEKLKNGLEVTKEEIDTLKRINKEREKKRIQQEQLEYLTRRENRYLEEGATLQERITHYVEKAGVAHGINIDKVKTYYNEIKDGFSKIKDGAKEFLDPWEKVDQAAYNFGKQIGYNEASIKKIRKETIEFVRDTKALYGSMEEIVKLQGNYNLSIGRSIDLTKEQKANLGALKEVVGEQTAIEFSAKLENFGLNPEEVGNRVGKMFGKASKNGLAFETYSKNFLNNIKLAQNYTFKRGLDGLEAMARKSTAIKLDMQQTANFADKVSTLEGAVEASAQLSVLGGDFAKYSNPLTMMYEGLNDMESLQDRVVKMFGNLGRWDYSKGQVDMSAFNRQRVKIAAKGMGMDPSSVMEMINNNARRNIVSSKLTGNYDEDLKELILNKSTLDKEGNAKINVGGESVNVNELTVEQKRRLKDENKSETELLTEIAEHLRGLTDVKNQITNLKDTYRANVSEKTKGGETYKKFLKDLVGNDTLMTAISTIEPGFKMVGGLLSSIHGVVMLIATLLGRTSGVGGGVNTGDVGGSGVNGGFFGKGGSLRNASAKMLKSSRGLSRKATAKMAGGIGSKIAGAGLSVGAKGVSVGAKVLSRGAALGKSVLGPAGLVAAGSNLADYGIDTYYDDKKKDDWYVGGKAATRAAEWGAYGAMLGTMFGGPGIGTGIGAAIGAAAGGIYGGVSAYKDKKKGELIERIQMVGTPHINDYEVYDNDELETMLKGKSSAPLSLLKKMEENGDSFRKGGYTGNGNIDEIAGVVHKGEIVIPNEITKEIIKPNGDLMNNVSVKGGNNVNGVSSNENVSFSPLNINFSGSIELKSNGYNTKVGVNELMTPEIIDKIIKEIQIRTNYALDRDKLHIKFG